MRSNFDECQERDAVPLVFGVVMQSGWYKRKYAYKQQYCAGILATGAEWSNFVNARLSRLKACNA